MTASFVERLARPEIVRMRPYESARSLVDPQTNLIYLDANESPDERTAQFNRYPEPQPYRLRARFAELYGVSQEHLAIGRGSDEAIDLLTRTFCCSGGAEAVAICPPTYGVYAVAAQAQGARTARVPLLFSGPEPRLDLDGLGRVLDSDVPKIKLIYLCSPNNPTGTCFDRDQMSEACRLAGERALVVVDEAYLEFSRTESMVERLAQHPNLVVLRTLSKAWAMAGVRCGVAIAAPEIVSLLHKVRAPYPLSGPSIEQALAGTDTEAVLRLEERVQALVARRDGFVESLRKHACVEQIFSSQANFVLVRFRDASATMAAARRDRIVLRDWSREPELGNCVRITIGTPAELARVLAALNELSAKP